MAQIMQALPVKQSQIWENQNTGQMYLLEEEFTPPITSRSKPGPNDSFMQSKVARDGSLPSFCDSKITGFVGFNKRKELSIEASDPNNSKNSSAMGHYKQCYSPLRSVGPKVPTTTYVPQNKQFYLPRQDKFDGYYQLPRPMVLPFSNNIDPGQPYHASQIVKQQYQQVESLLQPSIDGKEEEVIPSILSQRNKAIIQKFADKVLKLQIGQKLDTVGDSIPYLSGTRCGANFKAQSYREQVLKSISKHLPQQYEDYLEDQRHYKLVKEAKSSNRAIRNKSVDHTASGDDYKWHPKSTKPLTKEQKEKLPFMAKLESLRTGIVQNESGKLVNGVQLKLPSTYYLSKTRYGQSQQASASKTDNEHSKSPRSSTSPSRTQQTLSTLGNTNGSAAFSRKTVQGFATIKESYFQQPESILKPFIEHAKLRQQVSIHGDVLHKLQQDEAHDNHQPHYQFAQVSHGNKQVREQSSPRRTGEEVKFNMTQKKFDEESSVAQSIIITITQIFITQLHPIYCKVQRVKAKTQGRFGGLQLQVRTPAQCFSIDKSWQFYANPVATTSEKEYLDRDRHLLEKRRYQRVIKEIQCEKEAGVKGVTKMPQSLMRSLEQYAAREQQH